MYDWSLKFFNISELHFENFDLSNFFYHVFFLEKHFI